MMDRRIIVWASTAILVIVLVVVWKPSQLGFKPNIEAKSAILLDMDSEEIWVNINGDEPMPPANMSKLMIEMIVLDYISSGTLNWEDKVLISAYASNMKGATLSLERGEFYTVRELFEAISIYSANDAAVAMAEYLAGSESSFVCLMNKKAHDLGLSTSTVFTSASGLSVKELASINPNIHKKGDTMMTARDTAKLAAALIHKHPDILNISSRTQMHFKQKGLYVSNSNFLLPGMGGVYAYKGTDGLKAGYDAQSGYAIAGSAQRYGHRLVAIIMGAETYEARYEGAIKLFDYGFYRSVHNGHKGSRMMHPLGIAN